MSLAEYDLLLVDRGFDAENECRVVDEGGVSALQGLHSR